MPVILSIRLCIGSKNTNWKGPDEYIELILKSKPPIRSLFPGNIDFNSVQEPLLTWALSFDSNLPLFRLVATDHRLAPKYDRQPIAVSDIRSKSKEQLNERRAGLSKIWQWSDLGVFFGKANKSRYAMHYSNTKCWDNINKAANHVHEYRHIACEIVDGFVLSQIWEKSCHYDAVQDQAYISVQKASKFQSGPRVVKWF